MAAVAATVQQITAVAAVAAAADRHNTKMRGNSRAFLIRKGWILC